MGIHTSLWTLDMRCCGQNSWTSNPDLPVAAQVLRVTDHHQCKGWSSQDGTPSLDSINLVSCSGGFRQTSGALLSKNQVNELQKDQSQPAANSASHFTGSVGTTPDFEKERTEFKR